MASLMERHGDNVWDVLSCFDRVVIQGSLPGVNFADGVSSYLRAHNIRIFDYPRFAEPLRDLIRENAERLAVENGAPRTKAPFFACLRGHGSASTRWAPLHAPRESFLVGLRGPNPEGSVRPSLAKTGRDFPAKGLKTRGGNVRW